MGIVIRQSFKTLVVIYLGLVIGYFNTLWLYPLILSKEEIGLFRILLGVSTLFATLASLGTINVPAKYFPYFKSKENKHHGFLFLLILFSFIGFIVFTIVFLLFKDVIFNIYSKNARLLIDYFFYFIPFTYIILLINLFKSYLIIQQKPVAPNIVNEILVRIFIVIGLFGYFFKILGFHGFINFLLISYVLCLIVLLMYTYHLGELFLSPNFSILKSKYIKELIIFSAFALLGNASNMVILNIDGLMLSAYKGLGQAGIYTIAFFIATVIEIPKRSISQSVIPLVSEGNKNEDISLLDNLYKKSSVNQLIIGAIIFIIIWVNIENIFNMMPNGAIYAEGKWVVFFIGIGKLFDMTTGINGEILGTSKYYRYDLIFLVFLGILTVLTNIIFIPLYGIMGAALASAISIFIFNSARFVFVLAKMKIQPFTLNTVKVIFILILTFIVNYLIPSQDYVFIDIIVRSIVLILFSGTLIIITNSSEDINLFLKRLWKKYK